MIAFRFFIAYAIPYIGTTAEVESLKKQQEALEEDDVCLNSDSLECGMALLQRKAIVKTPESRISQGAKDAHASPASESTGGHRVILADPAYIALLKNVTTYSGESLYESVVDVSWSPALLLGEQAAFWTAMYEYDFPNTALFTWGSNHSDKLFVFTPGTNSLCMQYAATLHHIADHLGFFVVCPQLSNGPSSQESVMKPVCAVEWALTNVGNFSTVTIGGHSGGASTVPSTAMVLLSKGITLDAMVMWHPGVVYNMNVPGCAAAATGQNAAYCAEYFPVDLMPSVSSVKLMIIAGNFCEWSKVQNSVWLSNYGCCYGCSSNPPLIDGICPSLTFPTPSFRQDQPPVTCTSGCPDASFLAHPGDCMVETTGAVVQASYYDSFTGSALFVETCGEHDYGTMFDYGLKGEAKPFIVPFLHSAATKDAVDKQLMILDILSKDGTSKTCEAFYSIHDMCLFLDSPFSDQRNTFFTAADGSIQPCANAHKNEASGTETVTAKNFI